METTKECLKANMKRCIEILESNVDLHKYSGDRRKSELFNKLLEIRRDSIRFEKEVK